MMLTFVAISPLFSSSSAFREKTAYKSPTGSCFVLFISQKHATACRVPLDLSMKQSDSHQTVQRSLRNFAFALFSMTVLTTGSTSVSAEDLTCYNGEGPGCAGLAGDNPLIKQLQEKSKANKEKNMKELRDKWYETGYSDYFNFMGQDLIKNEDGTYTAKKKETPVSKFIDGLVEKKKAKLAAERAAEAAATQGSN